MNALLEVFSFRFFNPKTGRTVYPKYKAVSETVAWFGGVVTGNRELVRLDQLDDDGRYMPPAQATD
jgi:hypothetical protein